MSSRSDSHRNPERTALLLTGVGLASSAVAALTRMPRAGVPGFAASVLGATISPHLALGGLAGLAGMTLRPRSRRSAAAGAVCAAGTAIAVQMTWTIMREARRHGGRISLARALVLSRITGRPDAVVNYAPGPQRTLEIFRPARGDGSPVLFVVHGGGWKENARMEKTLRAFADQGWLVLRPAYPLAAPATPTWQTAPSAVAQAYAWVSSHARELGGDPSRIALFGDSAGGGLALRLSEDLVSGALNGDVPQAVVALYPTVDVGAIEALTRFNTGGAARLFTGGTLAEYPERYREVSASEHLRPGLPPTLIIQGSADSFVPVETVRRFVRASRRAGNTVVYAEIPAANHAFDSQAAGSLGFQFVTSVAGAFLSGVCNSHEGGTGEPTVRRAAL